MTKSPPHHVVEIVRLQWHRTLTTSVRSTFRICRYFVLVLVTIALVGFLNGCSDRGPQLFTATGQITFNDKPLANAGVVFGPADRSSSAILAIGRTDTTGAFTLTTDTRSGAAEGTYTVTVSALEENQSAPQDIMKLGMAKDFKPPGC